MHIIQGFSWLESHPELTQEYGAFSPRATAIASVMRAIQHLNPGDCIQLWDVELTVTHKTKRGGFSPDEPASPEYWEQRIREYNERTAQAEAEHEADFFTDKASEL